MKNPSEAILMSDFVRMGDTPITSSTAAASMSLADSQFVEIRSQENIALSIGTLLFTSLIGILAIAGVSTALFSMWVEDSMITLVAFAFPLITGPCILVQRQRLQWMPSFQDESNRLRQSVNQLAERRLKLSIEVNRMEREIRRMKDVEDRFHQVVQREGKNVHEFRNLVRENSKTIDEIKKAQAAQDLVDLFSVIMMSDRNEDNIVTESEADQFLLRIRAFAGRRGKILDEQVILDAFKRSMKNVHQGGTGGGGGGGQTTSSMFEIVQSALSDEMPEPRMSFGGDGTVQSYASTNLLEESKSINTQVADNGFITLKKIPRVTPTGLVVSESQDEEGNLAHPIKVEDLMYIPMTSNTPVVNKAPDSTPNVDQENPPTKMDEDNGDIVSMLLRSFSGGPVFS